MLLAGQAQAHLADAKAFETGEMPYGKPNSSPDKNLFDLYWTIARLIELAFEGEGGIFCNGCHRVAETKPGTRSLYCKKHSHSRKVPNFAAYMRALRANPLLTKRLEGMQVLHSDFSDQLNDAMNGMLSITKEILALKDNPSLKTSPLAQEIINALETRTEMLSSELALLRKDADCWQIDQVKLPSTVWKSAYIYLQAQYQAAWERWNPSGSSAARLLFRHDDCPPFFKDSNGKPVINIDAIDRAPKKDYPQTTVLSQRWRKLHDDATGAALIDTGRTVTPVTLISQWMRFLAWTEVGDGVLSGEPLSKKRGRPSRIDAEDAIRLVTVEGKTVDEVAARFHVTTTAVYALFHRRGIKLSKSPPGHVEQKGDF
jgi:hypothetical protein